MQTLYLVVGAAILLIVTIDLAWTTLWPDGAAGPLSRLVAAASWQIMLRARRTHPRTLSISGPVAIVATLGAWVTLLWSGWVLVFSGDPHSLSDPNGLAVSLPERIYFVGYTIFTMGNGDLSPNGGVWQITTALAVASGMVTVTLAVTYVLSIVRAVAQKRSFASAVSALGTTAEDVVQRSWDGRSFGRLDIPLDRLAGDLSELADKHRAFPVLHYYRPEARKKATPVAVAVLDDALTVLEHGADPPYANPPVLALARSSVSDYLDTLGSAFMEPADVTPPPPDLGAVRASGVPVVTDDVFASRLEPLGDRRRRLLGAVRGDEWTWPGTD